MRKTLAVGMTTAPRKYKYPWVSVESFRIAGFPQELHVFAEPKSYKLHKMPRVVDHRHKQKLGCFPNWKFGLTWLVENVEADWYMMVQDDVIYRNDTWKIMEESINNPKLQQVGFLSPYASAAMVYPKHRNQTGWRPARHGKGKGFWGALTICMPRESARMLLKNDRFQRHSHYRKVDVLVGNCFRAMNRPRMIHVPSLCNHIGKVSTLGRHKIKGISHGRRGFKFREKA